MNNTINKIAAEHLKGLEYSVSVDDEVFELYVKDKSYTLDTDTVIEKVEAFLVEVSEQLTGYEKSSFLDAIFSDDWFSGYNNRKATAPYQRNYIDFIFDL